MTKRILVVDDEKNIRTTVGYALEMDGHEVDTAVNGEDALQKMENTDYALVLLDLQMPGLNGIETLAEIAQRTPETSVAIVTAHGTIDNAVEAMKLGAIDFIQKPFTPKEIRALANEVLSRAALSPQDNLDYDRQLALVKQRIGARDLEGAVAAVKQTIAADPARPEAFNLLGALHELQGNYGSANKNYRVALDLDPTYAVAKENLSRASDTKRQRLEAPKLG